MKKLIFAILAIALCFTLFAEVDSFFESFDASDSMPAGWSTIIESESTASDVWVHTSSFDAFSGTNFVKMFGNADDPQDILVLVSPEVTAVHENTLNFYAKSSWGESTDTMQIGTLATPNDFSTFTMLETISLTADYVQHSIDFAADNTDKYIGFVNPLTSEFGYSCYLDDIAWESTIVVPNPAIAIYPTVNASNVLINFDGNEMTSSFEWSAGGGTPTSYLLNIGTDNPPTNHGQNIDLGAELTYQFDIPLIYSTQYFWQIIPLNENGQAVDCPVWSFTTMGNPIVDFNEVDVYNEGFESAEVGWLPVGMEQENIADDNSMWSAIANSDWSQNSHTGEKAVHMMFSFSEPQDDWLYTPPMNLIAGNTYTVSFWYKCAQFETSSEKMGLFVGGTPTHESMTTELWSNENITNLEYQQVTVDYTPTTSGLKFFSWHCYSNVLEYVLYVDDIAINETDNSSSDEDQISAVSASLSNYPNPFNPTTVISFELHSNDNQVAEIEIYNTKGQMIKEFSNIGIQNSVVWNGDDKNGNPVGSGVYFYKLNVDGKTAAVKKCMLLK